MAIELSDERIDGAGSHSDEAAWVDVEEVRNGMRLTALAVFRLLTGLPCLGQVSLASAFLATDIPRALVAASRPYDVMTAVARCTSADRDSWPALRSHGASE